MDTVAEAALSMSKYRCARGGSLSVASSTMSKTMAGAKEHLSDSPRTHHYYPPSLDLNDFGCQSGLQLPDIIEVCIVYVREARARGRDIRRQRQISDKYIEI